MEKTALQTMDYIDQTDDATRGLGNFGGPKDEMNGILHNLCEEGSRKISEMIGPDRKVVSVQAKQVKVSEKEVFLINGTPMALEGPEGDQIRQCLLNGVIPGQDLINHLLGKAGLILKSNSRIQTEINVKKVTSKSASLDENGTEQGPPLINTTEVVNLHDKIVMDANNQLEPPARAYHRKSATAITSPLRYVPRIESTPRHYVSRLLASKTSEEERYALVLWSRLLMPSSSLISQLESALSASSEGVKNRTASLVVEWATWFPEDFTEFAVMQRFKGLLSALPDSNGKTVSSSKLLSTLTSHVAAIKKQEERLEALKIEHEKKRKSANEFRTMFNNHQKESFKDLVLRRHSETPTPSPSYLEASTEFAWPPTCSSLAQLCAPPENLSPMETAHELTRIELSHLSLLGATEFVNKFANSSANKSPLIDEAQSRAASKTRHFDGYVAWFERLSHLVATSVVALRKKKQRVEKLEFWIETARVCVNIGNFNSTMGIITGLSMPPVARLKRTWHKASSSGKFTALEHQLDPSSNFSSYRSTFGAALCRSEQATDDLQRIIIPFFSLFTKDLFFAKETSSVIVREEESCKNSSTPKRSTTGEENSGEEKFYFDIASAEAITSKIRQFCNWKNVTCPFDKRQPIADYLQKSLVLTGDDLDLESYFSEKPQESFEKDRFKTLK